MTKMERSQSLTGKTERHRKEPAKDSFKEEPSEEALFCFQSEEAPSSRRFSLSLLSEFGS